MNTCIASIRFRAPALALVRAFALVALVSSLALTALACSGSPAGADADAGVEADAAPPVPPGAFRVTWGPLTVQPGVEDVRCVTVRLGNDVPLKVSEIHNVLGATSHHFIVYKAPAGEIEDATPKACSSVDNLVDPSNGVPLMITQKADDLLTLPQGVAFELDTDQLVRLELHYINASESPVDVTATATFTPIPESEFQNAADFLFIGNPDVSIPPMSAATLGPSYIPMPPELEGAKVFGLTGHEHQWGTDVFVETGPAAGGPFTAVYDVENFNWDEPETVYHDPPFEIPAGGGFRFTCEWFNQSDQTARFGEDVNDEMCFFWAYYYPSVGARTCFHTDQFNGIDVCCPSERDAAICDLIGGLF